VHQSAHPVLGSPLERRLSAFGHPSKTSRRRWKHPHRNRTCAPRPSYRSLPGRNILTESPSPRIPCPNGSAQLAQRHAEATLSRSHVLGRASPTCRWAPQGGRAYSHARGGLPLDGAAVGARPTTSRVHRSGSEPSADPGNFTLSWRHVIGNGDARPLRRPRAEGPRLQIWHHVQSHALPSTLTFDF